MSNSTEIKSRKTASKKIDAPSKKKTVVVATESSKKASKTQRKAAATQKERELTVSVETENQQSTDQFDTPLSSLPPVIDQSSEHHFFEESKPSVKPVNKIISWLIAIVLTVAVVTWMTIGMVNQQPEIIAEKSRFEEARALPEVQVRRFALQSYRPSISLNGETVASRLVTIRSERATVVRSLKVAKGDSVAKGKLLAVLDSGDTVARVAQAEAQVEKEQLSFDSITQLVTKGLSSTLEQADVRNRLEIAQVQLVTSRNNYRKNLLKAPFASKVLSRLVEVGDYVAPGTALFELADVTPVQVRGHITEKELVAVGNQIPEADVVLSTGKKYKARLSYLSSSINDQSKTFAIEMNLETGDDSVRLGLSADMIMLLAPVDAISISPSLLFLDARGNTVLKYVDDNGKVQQVAITIVDSKSDETWVTGEKLDQKNIIVIGQGFVFVDDQVISRATIQGSRSE